MWRPSPPRRGDRTSLRAVVSGVPSAASSRRSGGASPGRNSTLPSRSAGGFTRITPATPTMGTMISPRTPAGIRSDASAFGTTRGVVAQSQRRRARGHGVSPSAPAPRPRRPRKRPGLGASRERAIPSPRKPQGVRLQILRASAIRPPAPRTGSAGVGNAVLTPRAFPATPSQEASDDGCEPRAMRHSSATPFATQDTLAPGSKEDATTRAASSLLGFSADNFAASAHR
jgi:hypothetical protein